MWADNRDMNQHEDGAGPAGAADVAVGSPARPAETRPLPDFGDTENTFRHLTGGELRHASWLFTLMGNSWLSDLLSRLGAWAVRWRIPGAAWGVRHTIYRQFVGGTGLEDALPTIERLHKREVTSFLDYGAEAKSEESHFQRFYDEVMRAIAFSQKTPAANCVVVKVTGLAPNELLESLNDQTIDFKNLADAALDPALIPALARLVERLDKLASTAAETGVQLFVDAEESWFQNTIDQLAGEMMQRYNRGRVTVLNTFQLYRHDRLAFLKASDERAQKHGYLLGTKLVRGAYMVKEGDRAKEEGYPTPIQPSLEATHADYNAALRFCVENHERIGTTIGTHNQKSVSLAAALMDELKVPRNHPHINFAQLLGMSDNLTFNLAAAGYNASKYMVYGPVTEVLPYLVRRAHENTSVTGEMGRELGLIKAERKRRDG